MSKFVQVITIFMILVVLINKNTNSQNLTCINGGYNVLINQTEAIIFAREV